MTIEQTVEIPENGWFHLDLHTEYPAGTSAKVVITAPVATVKAENAPHRMTAQEIVERGLGFGNGPRMDPHEALEKASGIAKKLGSKLTSDQSIAWRREDTALEEDRNTCNFSIKKRGTQFDLPP